MRRETIHREPAKSSTVEGLTVSPALDLVAEAAQVPAQYSPIDGRVLQVCGLSIALGIAAAFVAQILDALITAITNLAFFGRFSLETAIPANAAGNLGAWIIAIPIVGALLIGFMA